MSEQFELAERLAAELRAFYLALNNGEVPSDYTAIGPELAGQLTRQYQTLRLQIFDFGGALGRDILLPFPPPSEPENLSPEEALAQVREILEHASTPVKVSRGVTST